MCSSTSIAKFKERFLLASENGFSYDCEFIVGPEKKVFEGHKMFFSLASEVLRAMFYGDLKEDNAVKIEDLDADGFEAMKYFIYTGEVNFSSTMQALLTYIAARKYLITALTKQCIVYIEKNIKPSEVLEVYEYCEANNISGFEDLCLRMIEEETYKIVDCDSFPMAKIETIQLILKSRRLKLESELNVFKLFEKWALAKAAQENISDEELATSFESLKKYIRFLKISNNDFESHIEQSLLLTQKEKQAIQSNLLESDSKPFPENLSVVQQQRIFLPIYGVGSEGYKYTINYAYSVDQYNNVNNKTKISIPLGYRTVGTEFEFSLTQEAKNFLCLFVQAEYMKSKPIFIMKSKVSVLAQDDRDDLTFINECRIMTISEDYKVLFAEINLDELENNNFLKRDNKVVTMIQVKFNITKKC